MNNYRYGLIFVLLFIVVQAFSATLPDGTRVEEMKIEKVTVSGGSKYYYFKEAVNLATPSGKLGVKVVNFSSRGEILYLETASGEKISTPAGDLTVKTLSFDYWKGLGRLIRVRLEGQNEIKTPLGVIRGESDDRLEFFPGEGLANFQPALHKPGKLLRDKKEILFTQYIVYQESGNIHLQLKEKGEINTPLGPLFFGGKVVFSREGRLLSGELSNVQEIVTQAGRLPVSKVTFLEERLLYAVLARAQEVPLPWKKARLAPGEIRFDRRGTIDQGILAGAEELEFPFGSITVHRQFYFEPGAEGEMGHWRFELAQPQGIQTPLGKIEARGLMGVFEGGALAFITSAQILSLNTPLGVIKTKADFLGFAPDGKLFSFHAAESFVAPTALGKLRFQGHVVLYQGGELKSGYLGKPQNVNFQGNTYPLGDYLMFYPSGKPMFISLSRPARIKTSLGTFMSSTTIDFYESGGIKELKLYNGERLGGRNFPPGAVLRLDEKGKILVEQGGP